MHNKIPSGASLNRQGRLSRIILAIGFTGLFLFGIAFQAKTTYADGRPGGDVSNPVVRAVDIAEPAVVRIFTTLGGHLTVQFSATNSVTFPQGTGNAYPLELSGSGTFISAHGDILTADHVINPPHDQSLDQFLEQGASGDVAAYINQNAKSGSQVTAATVSQELQSGQLPSTTSYDPATSEVFLNTSYTGPLTGSDLSSVPFQLHAAVDRIEMQSSFAEKDVAIVHVSMNDMPSVQLGDSSSVQQQDQLTIIGFPGNGDVSQQPTDLLTASVNTINVSSIKTTDNGAEVIQVGGNVEHGDSGGPGLNSNGSVVGIVSFGLSSPNSPGGTSFLQASNSARTLVQSLTLDTTPGPFQKAWSQAFTNYSANTAGHWHKALQEFTSIAARYPLFKAITPYLNYAQSQARNEPVSPTSPTSSNGSSSSNAIVAYAWTFGGIVLLLLLIVALFRVVIWRRRRRTATLATASSGINGTSQAPMSSSRLMPPPSGVPAQQGQQAPPVPGMPAQQKPTTSADDDGMSAFGAPPPSRTLPSSIKPYPTLTQVPAVPPPSSTSGTLRTWPCGHLNRSNARYCSICGEPASAPTIIRRVEP